MKTNLENYQNIFNMLVLALYMYLFHDPLFFLNDMKYLFIRNCTLMFCPLHCFNEMIFERKTAVGIVNLLNILRKKRYLHFIYLWFYNVFLIKKDFLLKYTIKSSTCIPLLLFFLPQLLPIKLIRVRTT